MLSVWLQRRPGGLVAQPILTLDLKVTARFPEDDLMVKLQYAGTVGVVNIGGSSSFGDHGRRY